MISYILLILHVLFWEKAFGIYVGYGSQYFVETLMLAAVLFVAEMIFASLGIQKLYNWAMAEE